MQDEFEKFMGTQIALYKKWQQKYAEKEYQYHVLEDNIGQSNFILEKYNEIKAERTCANCAYGNGQGFCTKLEIVTGADFFCSDFERQ